jgi:hypothetical protein
MFRPAWIRRDSRKVDRLARGRSSRSRHVRLELLALEERLAPVTNINLPAGDVPAPPDGHLIQGQTDSGLLFEASPLLVTSDVAGSHAITPGSPATFDSNGDGSPDTPPLDLDGVAQLRITTSQGIFGCSGTLISDRILLTAAHCLTNDNGSLIASAVEATWDLPGGPLTATANTFFVHPGYNGDFFNTGNDIALIEFSAPLDSSIPRYEVYRDAGTEIGQLIVESGFGISGHGSTGANGSLYPFGTKRAVLNRWESDTTLWGAANGQNQLGSDFDSGSSGNDGYGFFFGIPNLGFGNEEGHIASGDSGGPAFLYDASEGRWEVAGVASYGIRFGFFFFSSDVDSALNFSWGEFAAHTRVSSFLDFIDAHVTPPPPPGPPEPGITVTPTSGLVTTEAGGQATFSVVLNSQPTDNVTIDISSSDPSEGILEGATNNLLTLEFTPANWDQAQTVTVIGQDDDVDDGNIPYTIVTDPASSSDVNYDGLPASDVSVTNNDNDTAGITVTPTSGLVTTEAGGTDTFTVVLNSQPTGDVTIAIHSSDTSEGTVDPPSLKFTPTDWNTPQTVTVTGVDDSEDDGNIAYTIFTDPASSDDGKYDGLNAANVSVTNTDDDGSDNTTTLYYFTVESPTSLPASGGGSLTATAQDIIEYNPDTGLFSKFFAGASLGLHDLFGDLLIDAFTVVDDHRVLLSFQAPGGVLPPFGDGSVWDDSDIVLFNKQTEQYSLFFDASVHGLSSSSEDVDALEILPDGRLLVSTRGGFSVPGVSGRDEDVLAFTPSVPGNYSQGTWSLFFDGSKVGLGSSSEDVDAIAVNEPANTFYFSTIGFFSARGGFSGNDEHISTINISTIAFGIDPAFEPVSNTYLTATDLIGFDLRVPNSSPPLGLATKLPLTPPGSEGTLPEARARALARDVPPSHSSLADAVPQGPQLASPADLANSSSGADQAGTLPVPAPVNSQASLVPTGASQSSQLTQGTAFSGFQAASIVLSSSSLGGGQSSVIQVGEPAPPTPLPVARSRQSPVPGEVIERGASYSGGAAPALAEQPAKEETRQADPGSEPSGQEAPLREEQQALSVPPETQVDAFFTEAVSTFGASAEIETIQWGPESMTKAILAMVLAGSLSIHSGGSDSRRGRRWLAW